MTAKPFAITLDVGSSLADHTGSWRVERPVYVDGLPPCNAVCPAGEDIQGWLYHAEAGDYEAAWRRLVEDNPFPAIMGRICYRPCETACNRAGLDQAVGINAVERFLGDHALARGWALPVDAAPSGSRVMVVGAGPAGLATAYHLRRFGHEVVVFDADDEPGGMMRHAVPRFRLSREVLRAEIDRVLNTGVELRRATTVTDVPRTMAEEGFHAAFLAVGAQLAHRVEIPAGDAARVLDALALLRSADRDRPVRLGRRVVVYGGGDTAMDAARTARRLGATDAVVVYRRNRERMPAHDQEVMEAQEEGIRMKWLSTIRSVEPGTVVVEEMELDAGGLPRPTGRLEELGADSVVLALGQETDLSLLSSVPDVTVDHGTVEVGGDMMTGHPGVFAGGDIVAGERTVTTAVGTAKRAARAIDSWLHGVAPPVVPVRSPVPFDALNTWYYSDAPAAHRPVLDAARRVTAFDEVTGGLTESNALYEARRCLSCGNCFECDNCFGVCPDNAVIKLATGARYRFDYDYCKGCGLCAAECPCGAIVMEDELP